MGGYAVVLAVAAVVTAIATPLVRWTALRFGAVQYPSARSVHRKPMPTIGGAGMFIGFLAAMATASQIPQFHEIFHNSTEPLGLVLAAGVMFLVGAVDDLRPVSPPAKIAGQVLSGSLLSVLGVTMLYFRVPFASWDYIILSPDLAPLVTVLTVVLMANAINLIDGLDGLACGIVIIAGTALFLYSDRLFKAHLLEGSNIGPLVAILAVGVCVGFLPFNFNPARIFMGDAGAMFLGLLLAATTITVGGRTADQFSGQTYFFFAPLFIPVVILGVPMIDTAFSFVRRVYHRKSFAVADKDHLHHRLMRLGHGPRRAVVILWLWTALLSALVLTPTYTNRGNALVPVGVLGLALLLYAFFHPGLRRAREEAALAAEEDAADAAQQEAEAPPPEVVHLSERRRSDRRRAQ
ncbi:MAG: UDP-N-acetylmuramyl pentapeptide phosphotransferase/UDP-N-acetylglucosamine-phosphate transferase [Actinomycetia bacterium]|nr:UDP-N-acetylmuramyl pentapeptide phosphotransferase/UDP-N-acetylglucosamine-phosphate transferase [Actinomycetes bacterium]